MVAQAVLNWSSNIGFEKNHLKTAFCVYFYLNKLDEQHLNVALKKKGRQKQKKSGGGHTPFNSTVCRNDKIYINYAYIADLKHLV